MRNAKKVQSVTAVFLEHRLPIGKIRRLLTKKNIDGALINKIATRTVPYGNSSKQVGS